MTPFRDRLLSRVALPDENGCMLWLGQTRADGYGVIGRGPRGAGTVRVHRAMYELFVGPIQIGRQIDHLCRVKACVNPAHLEPVTAAVNLHRGRHKSDWTHCSHGHAFTPENTYRTARQRFCRTCARRRGREYLARRKAVA